MQHHASSISTLHRFVTYSRFLVDDWLQVRDDGNTCSFVF
jgi:hypothetical protein